MKSRITIEVDFDNGDPYIKVCNDRESDDVRDKLITHFRERLGHTSSWCSVRFNDTGVGGRIFFEIHPITPNSLPKEAEVMAEQVRLNGELPSTTRILH